MFESVTRLHSGACLAKLYQDVHRAAAKQPGRSSACPAKASQGVEQTLRLRRQKMGVFRHISDRVGGVLGLGGGGDDDDIVTQAPRTISSKELFYSAFTVLSCCRTILYIDR